MADPVTLKLDVYQFYPIADCCIFVRSLPTEHAEEMAFEFDNISHSESIEIRIWSVNDGRQVSVTFSGVALNWLGPGNGMAY